MIADDAIVNRRSFIGSILALAAAPAIVRADSLMRIVPRDTLVDTSMVCARIIMADLLARYGLEPHEYDLSGLDKVMIQGFAVSNLSILQVLSLGVDEP